MPNELKTKGKKPEYFAIGVNATNIIKKVGMELYCLMGEPPNVFWENRPNLLRYFNGSKDCEPLTEVEAKAKYAEITKGQVWV